MTIKRSSTTCTPSSSSVKSFGFLLGNGSRDVLSQRIRKSALNGSFSSFGAQNASWGESSSCFPEGATVVPQVSRNVFLQKDKEISVLLTLLRSNDFTGKIDPAHHSQYMEAPKMKIAAATNKQVRRLGETHHHRSDGHLLIKKIKSKAVIGQ